MQQQYTGTRIRSKKKRRRRRFKRFLRILGVIILFALLIAGICFAIFKLKDLNMKPKYKYYSLTEEASARAYVWLNQIEDMPLSYDEVRDLMGDIDLKVEVTKGSERGMINRTVVPGSYDDCKSRAKAGLEKAYREVLKARIKGSGYEGEVTDEMLNELMDSAYGLSIPAYLSYCDIQLLPAPDEVNEMYSGETDDK